VGGEVCCSLARLADKPRLTMPKPIEPFPDQPALIKIGSGADSRGAAVTFQSAEVPGQMFQDILLLIARMPAPASPADGSGML
jgi:hypothetical protein